jgi:hypothetical protein
MSRTFALLSLSIAFLALCFGIRAQLLAHRNSVRSTYPFAVGVILPIGVIVGVLPSASGLESNVLLMTTSLVSFSLSAAGLYLLWRKTRS